MFGSDTDSQTPVRWEIFRRGIDSQVVFEARGDVDFNIPDSQPHIHFGVDEAALNLDGTWHDAGKTHPKITNKMEERGDGITIHFSEYGFFKKDSQKNKYFRTDAFQIFIEQSDIDPQIFMENVNTGKWKFEIEEYHSTGGAIYRENQRRRRFFLLSRKNTV